MKCVLTVAGLGTRLLPLTKELPKEMLPIYAKTKNGKLILKPIVQVIFESLYEYGIKDYCFVVGRTKRAVRDHFTPDFELVKILKHGGKENLANLLEDFFKKLKGSNIKFTYQQKPIGFGDAIYCGEKFAKKEHFLLHAGDDIVISKNNDHLRRLERNFKKYHAEIACLLEKVDDPSHYGVVKGSMLESGVMKITKMYEKPTKHISNYAIIAVYIFKPSIFRYLYEAKRYAHPEKQLAEAFNIVIRNKANVIGILLKKDERRLDVGTPETYSKVLQSIRKYL